MLQLAILQGLQIATVLCCTPLLCGVINRVKAIVQFRRGPSIWQPYRDLWKYLRKGRMISEHASWVYRVAPIFTFITPLMVAMLVPVLTAYPLPTAAFLKGDDIKT
ncbi:MAG: NADH-quinone oxidoreductase subunit H [Ktedonobacteraceae bacterium]